MWPSGVHSVNGPTSDGLDQEGSRPPKGETACARPLPEQRPAMALNRPHSLMTLDIEPGLAGLPRDAPLVPDLVSDVEQGEKDQREQHHYADAGRKSA